MDLEIIEMDCTGEVFLDFSNSERLLRRILGFKFPCFQKSSLE